MNRVDKKRILDDLDLGSSVAENDNNLPSYFVPTVALSDFLGDRYDLIRGAKGSGKSAILRLVSQEQGRYPQLRDVVLVVATEHTGEPAFRQAFDRIAGNAKEPDVVAAWKVYLINLILDCIEALPSSDASRAAIASAEACGVRYRTTSSYKKIWWSLLRVLHFKKIGIDLKGGIEAEFPEAPPEIWTNVRKPLDFPELMRLCDAALAAVGRRCWLLVDRLDAAFQANPELEKLALRSLVVAYKDLMGRERIRPKLFFRTDLFDLVAGSGFRELTHVQDRTSPPITWDADKLLHMIIERFVFNEAIRTGFGVTRGDVQDPETRETLFYYLFPSQVDVGPRKPDTWSWMQSRIRDGNSVRTPRDLHGLVKNSAVKEREFLAIGQGVNSDTLIGAAAVREGLAQLSTDKIKTTLIAENPDLDDAIMSFKGQKAEQNGETLRRLLGSSWEETVEQLARIGFIERTGGSWKVPLLYREGLGIIQGAAFPKKPSKDEEE